MPTYTIPTTVADLVATSTKLRNSATKASKLEAIHQICSWIAWKAGAIEGCPSDVKQEDLAKYLGVSGPHVSKAAQIAKCEAEVILWKFREVTGDDASMASLIAGHTLANASRTVDMVDGVIEAINKRAQSDPTWVKPGEDRPCVSVDSMYKYLGIGKSGGESTVDSKLRKAAKQAQSENMSEADFVSRARQAWADQQAGK
jgi:hypothetical protein